MHKLIIDQRISNFRDEWNKMVEEGWIPQSTNFDGPTYWTVFVKKGEE